MADAKNTVLFPYETLKKLSMDAFQKFGFSEKEADIIQDVLLTSDLFGIQSHGMQRMVRYHKGITNGLIKIDAKPEIVKETPISAVIDGHDGMGQLLGHKAMEMAIEKAKKSGVGIVSVRNSNHYGIAGYYAKMASDQGLIGFSCTNTIYNVCSAANNNCDPGTPSSCMKKSIIVSPPAIQYLEQQDTLLPCPPQDHRQ